MQRSERCTPVKLEKSNNYPKIVDWIVIEVRRELAASAKLASKAVFIDEDGILRDLNGEEFITLDEIEPGSYYVGRY